MEKKKFKESVNETKTNLRMSWHFIRKRKKQLFVIGLLSIILSIISVIVPLLSAQLLLKLTDGLLEELMGIALFVFLVEITRNIVNFLAQNVTRVYTIRTITDVQLEMFQETLKIKTSEIDRNSSGTFIDRIKEDTQDIINIFSNLISNFTEFISNIGILFASLVISPYMFLYFLVTSFIIALLDRHEMNIFYERSKTYRLLREKSTGLAAEFIRGIKDVKLLNGASGILEHTKQELEKVNQQRIKMDRTRWRYRLLSSSIRDLFDVTFILLGILLISWNLLSVANLLVLYMYRGRIESLLEFYNRIIDLLKSYNLSATRVFEVLGDHFQKEEEGGQTIAKVSGKIEFQNVHFTYTDQEVLHGISFMIAPGERVGFVGSSGSGKSTIFNLISRLYPVQQGKILIDGVDIASLSYDSLRTHLALIPQDPYIFNFSILENLKVSRLNASMEEMIDACKKADIYERIMEFPDAFETEVGEGGVVLSGGEKQRLAIARSLLKNSNILLFDEATSALDNVTQDRVQKAIYGLNRSKTILIIAHRLSTVVHCDKIVVIDDGVIVDIGTHTELLDRCSKYQELFHYEEVENY